MDNLLKIYPALSACRADIEQAIEVILSVYQNGGKVLLCGNGGSAADCDHIAGELLKGFLLARKVTDPRVPEELRDKLQGSLPAVSLTSATAALTACLNDLDPDIAYAQLLYGLATPNKDLLIAISTSGNAKNVCHATRLAKSLGLQVVSLTGEGGGMLATLADVAIRVPANETFRVQEYHLPVYHHICAAVEAALFA